MFPLFFVYLGDLCGLMKMAVGNGGVTTSSDGVKWSEPTQLKDEFGNVIDKAVYAVYPVID